MEEWAALTRPGVRKHSLDRETRLDQSPHERTCTRRFRLIGSIRLQAAVRFEYVEQHGKGHIINHAVRVHGDEAGFDGAEIADVVPGHIVCAHVVRLVARCVDTQHKGPTIACLSKEFEAALAQIGHIPRGIGDEVVERLWSSPTETANSGKGCPLFKVN